MRNSVLILISAFFLSCEDPTNIEYPIGGDISQTYFVDTLSLSASTYLMDSAITSNQAAALVGTFTDPIFGEISSVAYLQPTLRQTTNPVNFSQVTSPFTLSDEAIYDSLVLRLINKDLILYGDTLPQMTIQVHRLNQPLSSSKNYNYDHEESYEPTLIASKSVDISDFKSASGDSLFFIRLRLPDEIGQELLALANTDDAKDRDTFSGKFRGFRVSAVSGTTTLTAFNLGSVSSTQSFSDLTIYHHDPANNFSDGYQFEFTAGRYNQISTNRAGTSLASLVNKTSSLESQSTGNKVYVQAGNGIAAKINFPSLSSLKNPQIGRAELVFSADTTAFDPNIPRAPFITMVELTDDQKVGRYNSNYAYVNYSLNASSGIISTYVDSTNQFIADITPYLQGITSQNKKDNGIVLVAGIPATNGISGFVFNAGLNRIVLQDFKLNLYYTAR